MKKKIITILLFILPGLILYFIDCAYYLNFNPVYFGAADRGGIIFLSVFVGGFLSIGYYNCKK